MKKRKRPDILDTVHDLQKVATDPKRLACAALSQAAIDAIFGNAGKPPTKKSLLASVRRTTTMLRDTAARLNATLTPHERAIIRKRYGSDRSKYVLDTSGGKFRVRKEPR